MEPLKCIGATSDYHYKKAIIKLNKQLKKENMADAQFLEGIRFFKPHQNAPSFVKAAGEIKKADLVAWLASQPDVIRFDIKESQKGSYYAALNLFEGKGKGATVQEKDAASDDSGLPF